MGRGLLLNGIRFTRFTSKNCGLTCLQNASRIRIFVAGLAVAIATATTAESSALAQAEGILSECNQFAESVNRNQTIMDTFESEIETFATNAAAAETLEEITAAASQYVDAVDAVTDNLSSLATELEALTFADDQLADYRSEYVSVVTGFNTALNVVGAAMAEVAAAESQAELSNSLTAVTDDTATAVEQIENLAVDESNLIDGVNSYCGVE